MRRFERRQFKLPRSGRSPNPPLLKWFNMLVLKTTKEMLDWSSDKRIGFVPTMGALHEAHLSLVRRAKKENDFVVVSVFVNPAQFGPNEDFEAYPKDFERDRQLLEKENVDVLFFPSVEEIYPEGQNIETRASKLANYLCGSFRPGHFDGVCTVVKKLFDIVQPARAYFGQKDFQQTRVIEQMVSDLHLPVEIVVCPTVREQDGLAMSSRNVYLSKEEREKAPLIYKTLAEAKKHVQVGVPISDAKRQAERTLEDAGFKVQYFSIASAETLEDLSEAEGKTVIAVAAYLGKTRLIDNVVFDSNKDIKAV